MGSDISLFDGACWYVAFLFSTTLHEASHAFTAYRLGDDTAYRGGQVSLDPTPHIKREPFGMVVIPILSYMLGNGWMIGWASAPYDPMWAHRHPRRAGLMAMAGPASNFLLMVLAGLLIRIGIAAHWFDLPGRIYGAHIVDPVGNGISVLAATLLGIFFSLNLLLFIFNLIPFPPLDGSSIPLLFLSDEGSEKYWAMLRAPGLNMIGLIVAWRVFDIVYPAIHLFFVNLLYLGLDHYG